MLAIQFFASAARVSVNIKGHEVARGTLTALRYQQPELLVESIVRHQILIHPARPHPIGK